jgi:hypothetical protein
VLHYQSIKWQYKQLRESHAHCTWHWHTRDAAVVNVVFGGVCSAIISTRTTTHQEVSRNEYTNTQVGVPTVITANTLH